MPSLTVLVLLFSAGWFTANMVGTQAGAAFVTTLTLKGKVVRVHGRPVKVLVPPHTVFHNGQKVLVPASTVDVTTTQMAIVPRTVTTTVPTTTVQTLSVTITQTITETSSSSSSSTTTSGSTTTATSGVSTTVDSIP